MCSVQFYVKFQHYVSNYRIANNKMCARITKRETQLRPTFKAVDTLRIKPRRKILQFPWRIAPNRSSIFPHFLSNFPVRKAVQLLAVKIEIPRSLCFSFQTADETPHTSLERVPFTRNIFASKQQPPEGTRRFPAPFHPVGVPLKRTTNVSEEDIYNRQ